jgi:F0F1-type ATP synthase membrane subunit b/b'
MNAPRTAREALIAELLGNVGKLHAAVQDLQTSLTREMDGAEERIVAMVGLLNRAGDAYRQHVKAFTADHLDKARKQLTSDAGALRRDLEVSVRQSLTDTPKAIHAAIESSLARHLRTSISDAQPGLWRVAGLCLVSSTLGAFIALGIAHAFF